MAVSEDKKRVMFTMSKEVLKKLELISKDSGLSKSAIVTILINKEKNV